MRNDSNLDLELTISYLYQSIIDIQDTIRAIDTKLGLLLIFLGIPFSNLGKIYQKIVILHNAETNIFLKNLYDLLSISFCLVWVLAFFCVIRGIISVDNPLTHIKKPDKNLAGSFYLGGQYPLNLIDCFINRASVVSQDSFKNLLHNLPNDILQIRNELFYEQSKLAYVRDIKLLRQRWAFRFTIIWLNIGFVVYFITKILAEKGANL